MRSLTGDAFFEPGYGSDYGTIKYQQTEAAGITEADPAIGR
jgi:hypothetical protein